MLLATHRPELVDEDGRRLTEQAPGDPTVACPYPDARQGRPMNAEALRQVNRHWALITATVARLCPPGGDLRTAWRVALAACTAPLGWTDGPLPGPWAALYKACLGFSQVFTFALLHLEEAEPGEFDDFWQWLSSQGWLMGTSQVCAGSRAQIGELFACFTGLRTFAGQGLPLEVPEALAEVVALQAALALFPEGQRLRQEACAPWMHALTLRPGVPPERTRAFFTPGRTPESLEELLSVAPAEREETCWRLARRALEADS